MKRGTTSARAVRTTRGSHLSSTFLSKTQYDRIVFSTVLWVFIGALTRITILSRKGNCTGDRFFFLSFCFFVDILVGLISLVIVFVSSWMDKHAGPRELRIKYRQ
jgi:hypothetical protein